MMINGDAKKSIEWQESCIDGNRVALYRKMVIVLAEKCQLVRNFLRIDIFFLAI